MGRHSQDDAIASRGAECRISETGRVPLGDCNFTGVHRLASIWREINRMVLLIVVNNIFQSKSVPVLDDDACAYRVTRVAR